MRKPLLPKPAGSPPHHALNVFPSGVRFFTTFPPFAGRVSKPFARPDRAVVPPGVHVRLSARLRDASIAASHERGGRQDLSCNQRRLPDCARGKVRKGPVGVPARGLQRSSGPDDRADRRQRASCSTAPAAIRSSPLPGGCFITAHEAEYRRVPLARHTSSARPGEPGGDTWGGLPIAARRHASAWMPGSYDPELNLVFWGTGVTAPVPEKLRGAGKADLLYTNSTLAIDPDTGKMVWYFQHLPRDNWDLDHRLRKNDR